MDTWKNILSAGVGAMLAMFAGAFLPWYRTKRGEDRSDLATIIADYRQQIDIVSRKLDTALELIQKLRDQVAQLITERDEAKEDLAAEKLKKG